MPYMQFSISKAYNYGKYFNELGYNLCIGSILIQFMKITNKKCHEWLPSNMTYNGK